MKIFKRLVAMLLTSVVMAGCGGGATLTGHTPTTSGNGTGTGTGTGTGSTVVTPAQLIAGSSVSAILADGSTTATITVIALDSSHNALSNVAIKFTATSGALQNAQATTGTSGSATVTLTTGFDPTVRTISVVATSGTVTSNTVSVGVIGSATVAPIAHLSLMSSVPSILADGSTTATITAYALDANYALMANVPVTFAASSGGIAAVNSTTDASGTARATLSTAGDPTPRTIKVTATAGGQTQTVSVNVVAQSNSLVLQLGSGGTNGKPFVPGVLGVQATPLSAGGSAVVQAVLVQSDGSLYTAQPVTVIFSSPCAAQNLATFNPAQVQTTTGGASTTYTANGCVGSDTITAKATVNGVTVSASATVTVAAASLGSISFVSASPSIIALKGLGAAAGLAEQSVVTFKVLDQNGNAYAGAPVSFALSTTVGNVSLVASNATSGTDGTVIATVQSGTVATPVRVVATVTVGSTSLSTQSSQLVVSTGIPANASFTLAPSTNSCPNVEALGGSGLVTVPLTATVSDRFNNPIPDGTAISFHTDGGQVQAQCFTSGNPIASTCSVRWTNQNPVKPGGKVIVLGVAIGEESFTDLNGNGQYDAGEPFQDVGEPYIDSAFKGAYTLGDYFYDFNANGVWDAPNGKFDGLLCNDPQNTGVCGSKTTAISANTLIITSGSTPDNVSMTVNKVTTSLSNGVTLPATLSLAAGNGIFPFTVADQNNNPMPAGTTIALSSPGTSLTVAGQTAYTVGCATTPGSYGFILVPTSTAVAGTSGTVVLTVTTPGKVTTQYVYNVSIVN
jgi:Bacterial Ig-like domain (group 1)